MVRSAAPAASTALSYLAEQLAKHLRGTSGVEVVVSADREAGEDGQMKAMILAAGLGTRLRPLTDIAPRRWLTVAGRTLLEITLDRLRVFGVSEVIVNAHHYAE